MKSKIRVEYDFDKKEPYLQFYIVDTNEPGTELDMRDTMLKHLVQLASNCPLVIKYPHNCKDNSVPQIRLGNSLEEMEKVIDNYLEFGVKHYELRKLAEYILEKTNPSNKEE